MWLKLVCLVKHRSEATAGCRGGHVKVNGQRVKPASTVSEGDVVEFLQGKHYRRVVVQALPQKPVSKEVARTMYLDQTPRQEIEPAAARVYRPRGSGRPTKRERRQTDRLKK